VESSGKIELFLGVRALSIKPIEKLLQLRFLCRRMGTAGFFACPNTDALIRVGILTACLYFNVHEDLSIGSFKSSGF